MVRQSHFRLWRLPILGLVVKNMENVYEKYVNAP